MKRKIFFYTLILSFFTLFIPFNLFASHYMGGEITWECLSTGQYIFTMKTYRECAGINYGASYNLTVTNGQTMTKIMDIKMQRISVEDISPRCDSATGPHIRCNPKPTTSNLGAVEEHIYQSAPITLIGTPPAQGWIFHWGS